MTIVVEPNPAIEGQPVTVRVTGPGPHYWRTGDLDWEEIPIDEETGRGFITLPPGTGGDTLLISDLAIPTPENIEVPIDAPT
jgi:hypothetical protein